MQIAHASAAATRMAIAVGLGIASLGGATSVAFAEGPPLRLSASSPPASVRTQGLSIWNATRRTIKAPMEAAGGIRLSVHGQNVAHPVTVDQLIEEARLTPSDGVDGGLFGANVSISGNRAMVGASGVAYIFERDPSDGNAWLEIVKLTPSDGPVGRSVSISGDRAIIGGSGAAYIFERSHGGPNAWGEVVRLTVSAPGVPSSFGASVSMAGDSAVVGAPLPAAFLGPGAAYVFTRDHLGVWTRAAALTASTLPSLLDLFGTSVAISEDTVAVGAAEPFSVGSLGPGAAYVFQRDRGGTNAWGRVAKLSIGDQFFLDPVPPSVSIGGNHTIVGTGPFDRSAYVFARNKGGPDAWGKVTRLEPGDAAGFLDTAVSIDGDLAVVGSRTLYPTPGAVYLFGRNQGGADAWGQVDRVTADDGGLDDQFGSAVAVGADTVLVGAPRAQHPNGRFGSSFVFVSDVDEDGIRDGVDQCLRDPLNNTAGPCRRSTTSSPVLNHLVTMTGLGTFGRSGRFYVTATFTNTGTSAIKNPFFDVAELTGGNVLANADGGPGGAGSTLSPDVGNGLLEPGEPTIVTFVITLRTRSPFRFLVNLRGQTSP